MKAWTNNRITWMICALLAAVVLGGIGARLVIASSATPRLSPADQAARHTLRRAVSALETDKISFQQFERLVPQSNVPAWRRLQRQIPATQSGSADLAFVLAYYGVDCEQNLQRLLLPYWRWRRRVSSSHDRLVLDGLPHDLALLYQRHRDARSLDALVDMDLDGDYAEAQHGAFDDVWTRLPAITLRLASGSSKRLERIEWLFYLSTMDALESEETVLAPLRRFSHHSDPSVRRAAAKILSFLQCDVGTGATSHQPLTDSRLKQLVMEFGLGRQNASVFRRVGLATILLRLASFQPRLQPETRLAYFMAFALAYFGQDYAHNIRRLTYALELSDSDVRAWEAYVDRNAPYEDTRDDVPELIARLYRHNRDPVLLRKLFSWHLDGGPAESAEIERVGLLTDCPLPVLQVLRTSPAREERALESLGDGVGAAADEYRRAVTRIRQAARQADPHLQSYTRRFLRRLGARWKIAQGNKDLRRADLAGMDLGGMDLVRLNLRGADLQGTDLRHTDLRRAKLQGADLSGARYDARTHWPVGFDPRAHRAILVR
jgi:hypothetical protein